MGIISMRIPEMIRTTGVSDHASEKIWIFTLQSTLIIADTVGTSS